MKVLQIFTFYPAYLENFYALRPELASESHAAILKELLADGFGALHFYAEDLPRDIYSVECIIANDPISQAAWLRDHGVSESGDARSKVVRQVNAIQPDILLVIDPVTYESRFVRSLAKRPRLIVGWRAATVPKGVDWTEFDAILSNHVPSLTLAKKLGAAQAVRFQPGFPQFIADKLSESPKTIDVCFSGSLSPEHKRRVETLNEVSKALLLGSDFSLAFYSDARPDLPCGINMHCRGSRWGMDMYRTLSGATINLNADPDFADPRSANMRLLEVTGCGGFLLTEHKENIHEYFQPGVEIETFKSNGEAIEKIAYYLSHPDERELIAANGLRACLERFSRQVAASALSKIFQDIKPSNNVLRRIKRGVSVLAGS